MFDAPADYEKFLSLLGAQKASRPFFLYAYCLMTNHVHLLIERQADTIGRIMHRVLTGYTQYYNRRYRRVGHLLQGRHKSILCQSDRYLSELVRYIHLNPVRAGMVATPEQYKYSGHRAYLGLETTGIVDIDPVLRHFGVKKTVARGRYRRFVEMGRTLGHQPELYLTDEGRILGTEEFVDATIHRIGETSRAVRKGNSVKVNQQFSAVRLIEAVEKIGQIPRAQFCGTSKKAAAVTAKELFVLTGRQSGASLRILSEITGISSSTISRRHDAAKFKVNNNEELKKLAANIKQQYDRSLANRKSQA
jgi:REP element-mobilizing transposase RayT